MCLFKMKIVRVELIEQIDGFTHYMSEDDKLTNLALGHMTGGFDGMVAADVYNMCNEKKVVPAKRRYRLTYSDGSVKTVQLIVGTTIERSYYNRVNKN